MARVPCHENREADLDLRSIEIFLAICEHGGFTAAANSLGLTQAAVSQHITKLERELEVTLIDRTVRPQKMTAAGEHLERRGRILLGDLQMIHRELRNYQRHEIPSLHLGLIESVAGALLPLIVRRLGGKTGSLSITSGTTHPLMPELLDGNFDLLVTSEPTGDNDALHCECLLVEPIVLVLPKGTAAPQSWGALAVIAQELDLVRYASRRRMGRTISSLLERHDIPIRGTLTFDSSAALFDAVLAGGSWGASTPMCLLSSGVDMTGLALAPFPGATPVRSINAIWREDRSGVEMALAVTAIRNIIASDIYPQLLQRAGGLPDRICLPDANVAPHAADALLVAATSH
ncbi:MAG: LysR family transcriptional regulator [Alphaproteobacteria bacterium]|nr:LysR family transcriptional regulator [Alphaproteobacteria bacterium]